MSYLSIIRKLRLKTKWDESETHKSVSGNPDSQWTLLIDCGKKNFIGLKSLNPLTVHYYKQGQLTTRVRLLLENIGGVLDPCEGEYMAYVPLNRLPELCKIVGARKKRQITEEQKKRGAEALKKYHEANPQSKKQALKSTQKDEVV